jgi:hypothetical protein
MVSQRLYPVIMKAQPELAPKITGMLRSWYLEHQQGPEELLRLLEDPAALNAKIAEAMEIWEEHVRSSSEGALIHFLLILQKVSYNFLPHQVHNKRRVPSHKFLSNKLSSSETFFFFS